MDATSPYHVSDTGPMVWSGGKLSAAFHVLGEMSTLPNAQEVADAISMIRGAYVYVFGEQKK